MRRVRRPSPSDGLTRPVPWKLLLHQEGSLMSDVGSDDLQREIQTLRNTASDFVNVVTSPAFLDALQAVNSAPEDQRLTEASKRLTPEALRDQGVPLPSDVRISSRYVEEGL